MYMLLYLTADNTPATFETPEPESRKDSPKLHSKKDHVEKKKEETSKDSKSGRFRLLLTHVVLQLKVIK